jgi:formylglycine-generating enzyme required for sulfatase activity
MTDEDRRRLEQLQHALQRALDLGAIDQDTFDAAVAAMRAQLAGSGAIAQGPGALGVGAQGVGITGDNYGDVNTGLIIQQGTRPGAGKADLRRAYLARILKQADQLPLFAGDDANAQIRLSSVYTALLTQRSQGDAMMARDPARRDSDLSPGREARLSALDVLNAESRLVLLGGPGSGKSTFVNFVALCLAGALLGSNSVNLETLTAPIPPEPDELDRRRDDDAPKPQRWDHGPLLPVHIVLRDFASELPAPGTPANAEALWRHIEGRLAQAALGDFAPHLRDELLTRGGLILLDGLDEVPDAFTRREQVKQAVQDFAATFSRCRFLVTSRTYAYQRQDWKLTGFAEAALLPFTPGQIARFVDAWYAHMAALLRLSKADAMGRAELLKRTIERNARLAELAERPLLLTLIARLHTERGGALPEKREELYAQAVELLLNQWESLKVRFRPDGTREIEPSLAEWLNAGRDDIRRELDRLAFEAHRDQPELVGTADIRQERLVAALLAAAPQRNDIKPRLLEQYLRDRAGLLASHGEGVYQFPHRTFQEYLAACHLTVERFPDLLNELLRADPNRWREATLLAAAKAARGTPESVWSLVEALCPDDPPAAAQPAEADLWGALLAGQALWETGLAEPNPATAPRNEKKRRRVQRWLRAIVERGWLPPVDRALAGRALSILGDDRDFDELISIPAGEFWMGDDITRHANPKHCVRLPAFKIGKYPVTNAQYRRFIEVTGRVWRSDDADKPDKRNHPALYASWHDALAYCAWLTDEWRRLGKIGPHEVVTLPSEAEWERAARATDGRDYPWGDWREDCANTIESGIGEACAVGMFPDGRSEAGCLDMAGNVWEWTRSLWGKDFEEPDFRYPYRPDDPKCEDLRAGDEVLRVVRGGSWVSIRYHARCAFRYRFRPDLRNYNIGFRVVVRSAPVP